MAQSQESELPAYSPPALSLQAKLHLLDPRTALLQVSQAKANVARAPLHLCLVLDTSGSMQQHSTAEIGDEKVQLAYYQLDLVVHAVKAMAQSLRAGDLLSIVAFESQARVLAAAKPMGIDVDLDSLFRQLDGLEAAGGTNMRPALALAMNCMRDADLRSGNNVMVFLTDGQPSDGWDMVERVERHASTLPLDLTMHTIAFGRSDMNVVMLRDMARITGGRFVYLDGPNMLGTVTSALLSNVLLETHCTLCLDFGHVTEGWPTVQGAYQTDRQMPVLLGSLQTDQTRSFLVTLAKPHEAGDAVDFSLSARRLDGTAITEKLMLTRLTAMPASAEETAEIRQTQAELEVATCLLHSASDSALSFKRLDLEARSQNPLMRQNLKEVVKGLAFDNWSRWGEKYAPALGSALWHQAYYNYKDTATHRFGTRAFLAQYAAADSVFDYMPMRPPRPVLIDLDPYGSSGHSQVQLQTAKSLNNPAGGCYYGSCMVRMNDGSSMRVDEVKAGMMLAYGARVEMILETVLSGPTEFLALGSLIITPWHPVAWSKGWVFPAHLAGTEQVIHTTGCMRSFLVGEGETVTVEGIVTAGLGHGVQDVKVLSHPFWGDLVRTAMRLNIDRAVDGVLQIDSSNLVLDDKGEVEDLTYY